LSAMRDGVWKERGGRKGEIRTSGWKRGEEFSRGGNFFPHLWRFSLRPTPLIRLGAARRSTFSHKGPVAQLMRLGWKHVTGSRIEVHC
jgi:hypothetical protein